MDISEEEKAKIKEKVEKLRNSRFKQQTLPAWRPIPSFKSTMITFTVFGVIFLALGIVLYVMSDKIIERTFQYNQTCTQSQMNCPVSVQIPDIPGPIYIYYQLDNFYQNHRRYVKSRSFEQLRGKRLTVSEISSDCDPITTVKELGNSKTVRGGTLNDTDPANPCGLVAKSFFTDSFLLQNQAQSDIHINSTGIAWDSDKQYKFKNMEGDNEAWKDHQWIDVTDGKYIYILILLCLPLLIQPTIS